MEPVHPRRGRGRRRGAARGRLDGRPARRRRPVEGGGGRFNRLAELELRRSLSPDGRLYLTIHDNHAVELFESGRHDSAETVRRIKSSETHRRAKDSFGMFTVGRDADSQVFYDLDCFSKTVRPAFDVLSITPEAYFYQTAFLLKRK